MSTVDILSRTTSMPGADLPACSAPFWAHVSLAYLSHRRGIPRPCRPATTLNLHRAWLRRLIVPGSPSVVHLERRAVLWTRASVVVAPDTTRQAIEVTPYPPTSATPPGKGPPGRDLSRRLEEHQRQVQGPSFLRGPGPRPGTARSARSGFPGRQNPGNGVSRFPVVSPGESRGTNKSNYKGQMEKRPEASKILDSIDLLPFVFEVSYRLGCDIRGPSTG